MAEAEAEASGQNPRSEASWRTAASGARRGVRAAEQRVQELDMKAAGLMYAPVSPGCNLSGSAAAQMTKEQLLKYKCEDAYTRWQGERQRTLDALARAKADLDQAHKDVEALELSARRQGAPPGWLRE
jgi:hypothetical protein